VKLREEKNAGKFIINAIINTLYGNQMRGPHVEFVLEPLSLTSTALVKST
jgi:hypothetical protein